MTLGNMRQLGVQNLLASCLNDACRHQGLIDVSSYPASAQSNEDRSKQELERQAPQRAKQTMEA
jgi:hypothetical protein